MAVSIKTKREIELMREANHRLEKVFDAMEKMIRPGISTWEIDQAARKLIKEQGGIPNFLNYEGYHSDAARTYAVGEIRDTEKKLIEVTKASFFEGLKYARAGHHLHEISNAIGDYCESRGYGVVRDLVGHGIGREMHEDPQVPNFRQKSRGLRLVAGMTLAIEPMIAEGTWEVDWLDDGWTVVTKDRKPAAHYENTILITDGDPEILSKTHD